MGDIQWYFPNKLDEVPQILSGEGVLIHAGGTGILRGGLNRVRALMDVSRLELKFLRSENGTVELGSALSYTETAAALQRSGNLLADSLSRAATAPLRNRITLGGSVALFPYWSDLLGPLLAMDAELSLVGATTGTHSLSDYLSDRELRRGSLIASIRIADLPWRGAYYRHTRTPTDRPAFSITILLHSTSGKVEEMRVVVVGCSGRFRRLGAVEALFRGKALAAAPAELLEEAGSLLDVELPARMGFSAEYLKACAAVELKRTLAAVLGGFP